MSSVASATTSMKSCEYAGESLGPPRSHPWTDAASDAACRYYDFKAEPQLIRTALEDFVPWGHYRAVTRLYELLEQLNAPASVLESNDCAFSPPHDSEAPQIGKRLQCDGRVMLLFRDLGKNRPIQHIEELKNRVHVELATHDQGFEWGMLGTTMPSVRFIELPLPPDDQLGYQLMISFWAWGDSEHEVMANLDRVLSNLARALARSVSEASRPD